MRKGPRQISFRVGESEYLKLQQSAETLNMSVPTFVKKKAQGSRLVAPKFDKATRQSIARDLSMLGNNMNQIAKYCNSNRHGGAEWEKLNDSVEGMRKELNRLWQQLN
ncbi:plasmid mobilization protein [Bacillus cereus]|uniref:plasmid mobilization protein n=1 Tax=Bacillus cereus TaxID=1396 RepID=UPI00240E73D7|nr:plasmid mobilization relaxosome protein MobC [Bacillus cereus]MDG1579347.1 plasmid mobilization relaxosome protein MobC [Bacillus cereus]